MGSKVISKMISNTIKLLIITYHEIIMNTMNSDDKIMMVYNHNKNNGHGKLLSYLSKLFV